MSFTDNSRRCLRWMRRFRHRRGYNIHSPFAFNLVTGVIYERGAYYAYDDLRNLRKTVPSKLRERDDRLLLRLINASMAKEALVIGDGLQMQTAYLRAGRPSCLFREITTSDLRTSKGNALKIHPVKVDFLYLDAPFELWPSAWKAVLSKRGEKAFSWCAASTAPKMISLPGNASRKTLPCASPLTSTTSASPVSKPASTKRTISSTILVSRWSIVYH